MSMRWVKAIESAAVPHGRPCAGWAEGRKVLVARLESGKVVAASPVCPHEGADLCEGTLYMGAVDCPRHHYLYDLETGENRYPRNVFPVDLACALEPLRLLPAKEAEGIVWVGLG